MRMSRRRGGILIDVVGGIINNHCIVSWYIFTERGEAEKRKKGSERKFYFILYGVIEPSL